MVCSGRGTSLAAAAYMCSRHIREPLFFRKSHGTLQQTRSGHRYGLHDGYPGFAVCFDRRLRIRIDSCHLLSKLSMGFFFLAFLGIRCLAAGTFDSGRWFSTQFWGIRYPEYVGHPVNDFGADFKFGLAFCVQIALAGSACCSASVGRGACGLSCR